MRLIGTLFLVPKRIYAQILMNDQLLSLKNRIVVIRNKAFIYIKSKFMNFIIISIQLIFKFISGGNTYPGTKIIINWSALLSSMDDCAKDNASSI